ncbi:HET-domain-containing protein [Hypomontagnella monticulosa]|nr:HET-domain-containing protein [Hypomontagnella monticulosa]
MEPGQDDSEEASPSRQAADNNQPINPKLCVQCRRWDQLDHVLNNGRDLQVDDYTSWDLMECKFSYLDLSENVHCIICKCVFDVVNYRSQESALLQGRPKDELLILTRAPFYLDRRNGPHERLFRLELSNPAYISLFIYLYVEIKFKTLSKWGEGSKMYDILDISTPEFSIYYTRDVYSKLYDIQPWDATYFQVPVLKEWISHCQNDHGNECSSTFGSGDMPLDFRVIDTEDMNIIKLNGRSSFVALSYTWRTSEDSANDFQLEKDNAQRLELLGALASVSIPNVISDAISLCRDLGERYLWVDRLCIIQDDEVSKSHQIAAMDRVYGSAVFTIMAALNDYAEGLPGCVGRPRRRYASWSRSHISIGDPTPGEETHASSMMSDANNSFWNRRGWTFQERILSKRRLFITEYQAVFACSRGAAIEAFAWAPNSSLCAPSYSPSHDHSLPISMMQTSDLHGHPQIPGLIPKDGHFLEAGYFIPATIQFGDFDKLVGDYSSRQLSYAADILHAFTGVANFIGEAFGTPIIFGLPEKYIAWGLTWGCKGLPARRNETIQIPSWSWASSLNIIDYDWRSSVNGQELAIAANIVTFYFQDPENGLRKLNTEKCWFEGDQGLDDTASEKRLPPLEFPEGYDRLWDIHASGLRPPGDQKTNEIWRECPHNPWEAAARLILDPEALEMARTFPGALVFNTTVASLKIRKGPTYDQNSAFVCNQAGKRVGFANYVSRQSIEARAEDSIDCVVISGSLDPTRGGWRRWAIESSGDDNDGMWDMDVLLVERLSCKPYVARRVYAGRVSTFQWKNCSPRWETVILC